MEPWRDADGMLLAELVGIVVVDVGIVGVVVGVDTAAVVVVVVLGVATAAVAEILQQNYCDKCAEALSLHGIVVVADVVVDLDVLAELGEQILFHLDSLTGKFDAAAPVFDEFVLSVHISVEED